MLNIPSPPIPLDEFRVSYETGFLPINTTNNRKLPLHRLSNPYFSPWEDVISDLPQLIQTGEIRQKVLDLPVLSIEYLDAHDEAEWQRAYLVLAFLTHAYIWGGEKAEDVRSPFFLRIENDILIRDRNFHQAYPAPSLQYQIISNSLHAQHMQLSISGTLQPSTSTTAKRI